jgi:hypothetical protein
MKNTNWKRCETEYPSTYSAYLVRPTNHRFGIVVFQWTHGYPDEGGDHWVDATGDGIYSDDPEFNKLEWTEIPE